MHDAPGYPQFYDENLGIVKNPWERRRFLQQIDRIDHHLRENFPQNTIQSLDLGAGTGNLTLPLLQAGHSVTAVDLSDEMLKQLSINCRKNHISEDRLEKIIGPVDDVLNEMIRQERMFHLITACSFYHHLPDYLETLQLAARIVRPGGFLFLAHEPMRKDTLSPLSRLMQTLDFKWWRIKGRIKNLVAKKSSADPYYDPNSLADYWDLTTGCDQTLMCDTLNKNGFEVNLTCYDSRRSLYFHHVCRLMKTKTLFMISGHRRRST